MKKITFLLLLLYFPMITFAQWGIKGGGGISSISGSKLFEPRFSGHIGGLYSLQLSNKWYFQPELLFVTTGANLKNDGAVLKDGYIKMYAFEAPLNISYRPCIGHKLNLIFDFGLYIRSAIYGSKKYLYYSDIDPNMVKGSPFDAYNRFDTGFNLGIGIQRSQYFINFTYLRGLSHAAKNMNYYNQSIRISLGYLF